MEPCLGLSHELNYAAAIGNAAPAPKFRTGNMGTDGTFPVFPI